MYWFSGIRSNAAALISLIAAILKKKITQPLHFTGKLKQKMSYIDFPFATLKIPACQIIFLNPRPENQKNNLIRESKYGRFQSS